METKALNTKLQEKLLAEIAFIELYAQKAKLAVIENDTKEAWGWLDSIDFVVDDAMRQIYPDTM